MAIGSHDILSVHFLEPMKVTVFYDLKLCILITVCGHRTVCVAVNRGYDTYFRHGLLTGYADCKCLSDSGL